MSILSVRSSNYSAFWFGGSVKARFTTNQLTTLYHSMDGSSLCKSLSGVKPDIVYVYKPHVPEILKYEKNDIDSIIFKFGYG